MKISIGRCKSIILGACYRPPNNPASHLADLENTLLEVISSSQEILVVEDFNCNFLKSQESPNKELIEIISSYHLSQVISEATRVTAETQTLIDLIIKTPTLNTIKSGVYHSSISDHSLVYCILQRKRPKPSTHYETVGSYKNFISEKFGADLSQLPLKDCLKQLERALHKHIKLPFEENKN